MSNIGTKSRDGACRCGQTIIELTDKPIASATCFCEGCRTAARRFERDLGAPPTVNADGGVDYCLYRKDRVKIASGAQHLREYRLKETSPTRRAVTSCCNSPMFLDYTLGHWLTVYRDRMPPPAPAIQVRVMAKEKPEGLPLSKDISAYDTAPPGLMFKLLVAWAAMGFRRPKIVW
jgi:hypothetical protein